MYKQYLLLIGWLGVFSHSPAQIMTVITTLNDGSRDTIKFGYTENATLGEDDALGEENIFMTPIKGYEGRIMQRDEDNFSCALLHDQTPVYYLDNFDSKVNIRNAADTSLQNRMFETWYSDSNTDSMEMICDIPISSFLQTAYWYSQDCAIDPPFAIVEFQEDTITHNKFKVTPGLGIKHLIYIIDPKIFLTSDDDHPNIHDSNSIKAFPNPFTDFIHITNSISAVLPYEVFDIYGKSILRGNGNQDIIVDTHMLVPGVYSVNIGGSLIKMIKH